MEKPTIEFTPESGFLSTNSPDLGTQTLSHNASTGDSTVLLTHAAGSEWGDPICKHAYWEEVYIISGRIYDKTLQKWFTADSYCCRPPGMLHGPYKADDQHGCREICFLRYPPASSSLSPTPNPPPAGKAIFFDLMGTCLDWHSGITRALSHFLPPNQADQVALAWRAAYFKDITARFHAGIPVEDIDDTHRRTLDPIYNAITPTPPRLTVQDKETLVQAWHAMPAWPDVHAALTGLRNRGYKLFVLANGTTRLQLDLMASSGLGPLFDMLFSSELLGITKPDLRMYRRAMELVGVTKEESVMVAAHAYDLRAAGSKEVGMRTVYIRRTTEDGDEDMELVRKENTEFGEGMEALEKMVEQAFKAESKN